MNPPLPNFYDPENARHLAGFAAEAYTSAPSDMSDVIEDPATDTRVVLWQNATDLVIAFRGTADLRNWLTDADCVFHHECGCRVHAGFARAVAGVAGPLDAAITNWPGRVWLTGHSLGGALAMLHAWRLMGSRRANPVAGLYTFGQPRVGDAAFRASWPFQAGLNTCSFRVVNADDIVPHVPWLLGRYRHAGHEIFYDVASGVSPDDSGRRPDPTIDRPFWQYAAGDLGTLAGLYLRPQNIGRILAAHHISRYVGLFSVPFAPSVPLVPSLP